MLPNYKKSVSYTNLRERSTSGRAFSFLPMARFAGLGFEHLQAGYQNDHGSAAHMRNSCKLIARSDAIAAAMLELAFRLPPPRLPTLKVPPRAPTL
jgi:hypothetical protein